MGTYTMILVSVLLTYVYKKYSYSYSWVSIFNIYFLPFTSFIHRCPQILMFLTSLVRANPCSIELGFVHIGPSLIKTRSSRAQLGMGNKPAL